MSLVVDWHEFFVISPFCQRNSFCLPMQLFLNENLVFCLFSLHFLQRKKYRILHVARNKNFCHFATPFKSFIFPKLEFFCTKFSIQNFDETFLGLEFSTNDKLIIAISLVGIATIAIWCDFRIFQDKLIVLNKLS